MPVASKMVSLPTVSLVSPHIWPVPSPPEGFGGLSSPKQNSKPTKLKFETLEVSGILVKFEWKAPQQEG